MESRPARRPGKGFDTAALLEQKHDAIDSPQMIKAFETFRKVLSYTDANRANRDWNLATAMVINGDAAMQLMGDWASGEFMKAKKVAGRTRLRGQSRHPRHI